MVAIVAETREQAEDALRLIDVQFERLPAVVDLESALGASTPLIHPELGDNLCFSRRLDTGCVDEAFAQAEAVAKTTFAFAHHTGVTLEPRCQIAERNSADQRLTVYHSFQAPHMMQDLYARQLYARQLDLSESAMRVVCRDVGGSFASRSTRIRTARSWLSRSTT